MAHVLSLRMTLAGFLLAGVFLAQPALRAQTASEPAPPPAVRSSGVLETSRQSVQAVGEATS
ncbi:MAG: hypothetical protein GX565_00070, partial [Lentisphaerae bacterium]|nr:hypothetical protein [Lentisphaerota bacterium]